MRAAETDAREGESATHQLVFLPFRGLPPGFAFLLRALVFVVRAQAERHLEKNHVRFQDSFVRSEFLHQRLAVRVFRIVVVMRRRGHQGVERNDHNAQKADASEDDDQNDGDHDAACLKVASVRDLPLVEHALAQRHRELEHGETEHLQQNLRVVLQQRDSDADA